MKRITLTFDNGPHPIGTCDILDVLAQRNLRATFFVVAAKLRDAALMGIAREVQLRGHRLANHTLTHGTALGRTQGMQVVQAEIGEAQDLLAPFDAPRLFRPNGEKGQLGPHLLSEDAVEYLKQQGFTAVCWNCVPIDWEGEDGEWVDRAWNTMRGQVWSVVVLHDHCQAGRVQHLERFLDEVIAQGYEFSEEFPADVLLVDAGERAPALEGRYTARP